MWRDASFAIIGFLLGVTAAFWTLILVAVGCNSSAVNARLDCAYIRGKTFLDRQRCTAFAGRVSIGANAAGQWL